MTILVINIFLFYKLVSKLVNDKQLLIIEIGY